MDEIETNFIDAQKFKPWVWFRYIEDVLFIWTNGKEKLEGALKDFNNCHPNNKFTHEFNKSQICTLSLQTNISTCTIHLLIQTILNFPLFLVKSLELAGYALTKQILKDIWTIWNHGSKQETILNI